MSARGCETPPTTIHPTKPHSRLRKKPILKTHSPLEVALAWNALGFKWLEMMAASSQVIARRTRRQATPARLYRMGAEKMEAAIESSNAMAREMIEFPTHDLMAISNAWARVLTSGMAPYHSRVTRTARSRRRR
jgi:hypothetical protein